MCSAALKLGPLLRLAEVDCRSWRWPGRSPGAAAWLPTSRVAYTCS